MWLLEHQETSEAGEGTRTPNLLITNQLLYQLSYASARYKLSSGAFAVKRAVCNPPEGAAPQFQRASLHETR